MGNPTIPLKKLRKAPRPAPKAGEVAVTTGMPRRRHDAPANPVADQTNWRHKMQPGRIKFDDVAKAKFLKAFAENGRKKESAEAAGVTLLTVTAHRKNDPDFAMAFDEAAASYRDKFVKRAIEDLAYKGTPVKKVNPFTGEVYEEKREHSAVLVAMELKRIDAAYRDKQEVSLTGTGGVLVVPGAMTPAEWVKDQARKNEERVNPTAKPAEQATEGPPVAKPVEVVLPCRAAVVAARKAGKAVDR